MHITISKRRGMLSTVGAGVVLAMTLAACGSSGGGAAASAPPSTAAVTAPASSTASSSSPAASNVKVGLAFDIGGKGDHSFNDSADAGLTKAMTQLGVKIKELSPNSDGSNRANLLKLLAGGGYNPVIGVGFSYADAITAVAKQYPKTSFVIIDDVVSAPNVRSLTFAANQSSYLVGAAAALASKTHKIGYIEALKIPLLESFRAGYEAGARKIDPTIKIDVRNLSSASNPFDAPDVAKESAAALYSGGDDVVYQVAGGSGEGVFQAAVAAGAGKLAIGVDSDQYTSETNAAEKKIILTSALKQVDVGVFDSVQQFIGKGSLSGTGVFDLANGGVGYSTSNPIVQPYEAQINALATQIKAGTITVPTAPTD